MDGLVVGMLGTLVGVVVALLACVFALKSKIEVLAVAVRDLRQTVEASRNRIITPSSHLFFTALAREAEFWEKLSEQRADKVLISATIASEYIEEDSNIIIDSGTTVDQIPQILEQREARVKVYTNNLLAAISVVPPPEDFDCFLLSGRIDRQYGATYNVGPPGSIEAPLVSISAKQIVLACPAISFDDGPMVDAGDHLNQMFKRELVRKALEDGENPQLIIAVDYTKFRTGSVVQREDLNVVLDQNTWRDVRSRKDFVLVATAPPDRLKTPEATAAREAIKAFEHNMKKRNGGMKITICSPYGV